MEGNKLFKFLLFLAVFNALFLDVSQGWLFGCKTPKPSGTDWLNDWRNDFDFRCPKDYKGGVTHWHSHHEDCPEDRVHSFECRKNGLMRTDNYNYCAWTRTYVNEFDEAFNFKCSHNGFITGIKSVFSRHYKDRRFMFRCCHKPGYIHDRCTRTGFLNNWDEELDYTVPRRSYSLYYLVGVNSEHRDRYQDRRTGFEVCTMKTNYGNQVES